MSLSQIDIYVKKEFLCKRDYAKATTGDTAQDQKFSFKRRASEAPNKGIRRGEYVETASFQCQSHPGKYQYPNGSLPARSWATPQKKRVHSGNGGGCSSHLR
ncbi:Alpha-Galactosidase A [Manis pentadactyla]|nr:Alpha-Galactosidase A [Manis pentadactyla]